MWLTINEIIRKRNWRKKKLKYIEVKKKGFCKDYTLRKIGQISKMIP